MCSVNGSALLYDLLVVLMPLLLVWVASIGVASLHRAAQAAQA